MLTRLKLQRGEGKLLVAMPEIRTRRRRATREPSPPKVSLTSALEAPRVLSLAKIEEVQAAPKVELESIAIMLGVGEIEGRSEKDDFKKYFNDIKRMVKVMFDAFTAGMEGEGSNPPHGVGTSDDMKD